MSSPPRSDALVVLGTTGDLAYKKIFPALQAMVRHGSACPSGREQCDVVRRTVA